jgi:hypothetical protein
LLKLPNLPSAVYTFSWVSMFLFLLDLDFCSQPRNFVIPNASLEAIFEESELCFESA